MGADVLLGVLVGGFGVAVGSGVMVGTGVQVAGKKEAAVFVGWTFVGWTTAVGILVTIATAGTAGIAGLDVAYHTTPPAPTSAKHIMIATAIRQWRKTHFA